MTVKELIKELQKYPEDKEVEIYPFDYDNIGTLFPYEIYDNDEKVIIETA